MSKTLKKPQISKQEQVIENINESENIKIQQIKVYFIIKKQSTFSIIKETKKNYQKRQGHL